MDIIFEEKNKIKIEKMIKLRDNENIENICEINNRYFAYQTKYYIVIINIMNFKKYRKIKISSNGICKYMIKLLEY